MKTIELTLHTRDQTLYATSPQVGRISLFSELPSVLTEGSMIGTLQTLRTRYALVMPKGGPWKLRAKQIERRETGVGVGEALLELRTWEDSAHDESAHSTSAKNHYGSPMAGQFYLRPTPEDPPFIRIGDTVEPGTQLGLVEVMKFFYPLVFEGEGRWRITEILAKDASALEAGDPVIAIEPVDD